ncbi:MAG: HipA domain-containing protein, partial [Acidobacteriota bacterium]|nr:HipA domain-containing protein [Acidobacteriota bacterium]
DHLRNHGFLRDGDGWRLSPAFDVSPNPDKHDHVLALDENSSTSPDSERVMATARFYRLSDRRAQEIATDVLRAVRGWEKIARAIGMRSADMDLLRGVIYLPPNGGGGGGTPVKSRRPRGLLSL